MTNRKLDAEPILQKLAEIRKAIPCLPPDARRQTSDVRALDAGGMQSWTEEDFEYAALADGLTSMAADLAAAIEHAAALASAQALEIYYAAEELARDPKHPELIAHVERMRGAYERQYGRPIPARPTRT